jgi:hypothetical protein
MGPIGSPQVGPGAGNAQTLGLSNTPGGQNIQGSGTGNAIADADIVTLTNAAAADMLAQLEAATNIAIMQGWITGNP